MSFLIWTNDQTVIFHSSTLPLTLFPSALGFPAQWHIMWLTMCLCHHSAGGKTQPVYYCLLTQVQPFDLVGLFFHSVLGPDCHNVRKCGKASLMWPQHFSTPTQGQGGNPQHAVCLALTSMDLRILPKAFSLWKQRDLGWNLTQLFGECRGPPQVGNDVRAWEEKDWTDSQEQGRMRMSNVEFLSVGSILFLEHNCLVFCLQCFFPRGLQRFHLYLENSLSQHPRACFIPLRDSCFLISDIIYICKHIYWYSSTVTCNDHLE